MELILVRHGEPQTGDAAPSVNPPLTDRGLRQAAAVGAFIPALNVDVLVSSGMRRAHQTALPAAENTGLEVLVDERFAEIDAGGGNYKAIHDIRNRGEEAWAEYLRDPFAATGVDEAQFRHRVLDGLRDLMANNRGRTVALFTHGFPINLVISEVLGVNLLTRIGPSHASLSRFAGRAMDSMSLQSFNETGHLIGVE
jgi:broad specificity phosphatase PhoE